MVKTQGRRGEVACEVLSDVPDRFTMGMRLLALPRGENTKRRELEVEGLWPHKGMLVLKFVGVDSISNAEMQVGCELQLPSSQRAVLDEGWKYVSDLVGCGRRHALGGNSFCGGISRQCGCGSQENPDEIAGRIAGSECAADGRRKRRAVAFEKEALDTNRKGEGFSPCSPLSSVFKVLGSLR